MCLGLKNPALREVLGSKCNKNLARRNRSDVCDLRLRCPSRTPEIARFPRQEQAMLHCDLRVRWKVASDLRFRAAISEPKTPPFCGISGDLAPSTRKSLAIAIVRFWCAKNENKCGKHSGKFVKLVFARYLPLVAETFKQSLRNKCTLISEPRFSTPCEMRFFPRETGKTAFSEKNPRKRPFSLSRVGKIASRRG